jgi:hypothetical protein
MFVPSGPRFTFAAIAVAAVALLVAAVGSAAREAGTRVPTSVLLFSGPYGGGTYTGHVAVQRTAAGKGRIVGLLTGLAGGKADVAIVASADCAQPIGHEIVRGPIKNGSAFDVRGNMSGSISGRSLALFFADGKQFVCYRLAAPRPSGAAFIMSATGNPSAATTGTVTMQRRPVAVGVVVLTKGSTSSLSLQPSTSSCSAATAPAGKPLHMVKKEAFFYGDIFAAIDFPTYRKAHSLVFTGASGKVGCVKWQPSDYDALLS